MLQNLLVLIWKFYNGKQSIVDSSASILNHGPKIYHSSLSKPYIIFMNIYIAELLGSLLS